MCRPLGPQCLFIPYQPTPYAFPFAYEGEVIINENADIFPTVDVPWMEAWDWTPRNIFWNAKIFEDFHLQHHLRAGNQEPVSGPMFTIEHEWGPIFGGQNPLGTLLQRRSYTIDEPVQDDFARKTLSVLMQYEEGPPNRHLFMEWTPRPIQWLDELKAELENRA